MNTQALEAIRLSAIGGLSGAMALRQHASWLRLNAAQAATWGFAEQAAELRSAADTAKSLIELRGNQLN